MKPLRTVALLVPVAFGLLVHWMIGHPLEWLAIMGGFFACFLCGVLYEKEQQDGGDDKPNDGVPPEVDKFLDKMFK